MSDNWKVIVNPNAGVRRGEKDWPEISILLSKHGFVFDADLTERRGHAIELTQKAIAAGHRNFIVVGGDGTLNEVTNGILWQKDISPAEIKLGMITVGTGNDWGKTFQIPSDYNEAIEVIKNGKVYTQDVGFIEYKENGNLSKRYFVNIAGIGFDARVVEKVNREKEKGKGGSFTYFRNLMTNLVNYKAKKFKLDIDGKSIKGKLFSLSVGVCKFNGNGMMQLPNAIPDDGILDITLINKIGKIDVIRHVNQLYDGSFINHPKVDTFTGKQVKLSSIDKIFIEADGETLGFSPCSIQIIPGKLNVIINKLFTKQVRKTK